MLWPNYSFDSFAYKVVEVYYLYVLISDNGAFATHAAKPKIQLLMRYYQNVSFLVVIVMEGKHCESLHYLKGIKKKS